MYAHVWKTRFSNKWVPQRFTRNRHVSSREWLKSVSACILLRQGFGTQEMVEKSVFLVGFLLLFFQVHLHGIICRTKHCCYSLQIQRCGRSLRSRLLQPAPVSCLWKRMVYHYFSFHPSFTSAHSSQGLNLQPSR